jgi:hypothetical protein
VSVTKIDQSDRYDLFVEIDGRQEVMSVSASALEMLAETWPTLKSGAVRSMNMRGETQA